MESLAQMRARTAQAGRIAWIGLRPARRATVVPVAEATVGADGLAGDHGRGGKRAVTLLQAEHLPAIAAYLGREAVAPADLRRNVLVAGINLAALKDRDIRLGEAVLRLTVACHPCSRMEEALGPGGYSALRGHGGWCARVVRPGMLRVGDPVAPAGPLASADPVD